MESSKEIKVKKNLWKNMNKGTKGITLIALVITIIVLLILAGVSITTLTGENGILGKAQKAADLTNKSTVEEEIQVEILGSLDNGGKIDLKTLSQKLGSKGVQCNGTPINGENNPIKSLPVAVEYKGYDIVITEENSASIMESELPKEKEAEKTGFYRIGEEMVAIPAGFKVSDTETTIENGLVIKDAEGNEFVWIPCTIEEYQNAKHAVMKEDNWSYNGGYKSNGGGDGLAWRDDYTEEDLSNINEIYGTTAKATISEITKNWTNNQTKIAEESIKKYKGFYIARYEAGIPSDAPFYTAPNAEDLTYQKDGGIRGATTETGLNSVKDLKPVSQKGVQAWNFITQPNAKIVAENMYKGNASVGSYLVDSQAWNHICKNIYEKNQGTTSKEIRNSSTWGNYTNNTSVYHQEITGLWAQHAYNNVWLHAPKYKKGTVDVKGLEANSELGGTNWIELPTGASDDFKNYNIYDMAGNMWEWTTGHNINNKTLFIAIRGRWVQSQGFRSPSRVCGRTR